jgi:hypothetical protein
MKVELNPKLRDHSTMIIAVLLATTPINQPLASWKDRYIWQAIYEGNEKLSNQYIEKRDNYLYPEQAMNLFMKAYLIYRIEMKSGNKNPDAIQSAFKEIDTFVECLIWLD